MTVTLSRRVPPVARPPSRRPFLLALGAALVALLIGLLLVAVRDQRAPGDFSDDFNGPAGAPPSAADWLLDTGTGYPGGAPAWGTGEVQTYTRDRANVALDGQGHLRITPTRDDAGAWSSARLETRRADFQAPPGGRLTVSARIRLPDGGPGYWSAFWMLGAPFRPAHTDWPGAGEIDVLENIGTEPELVHGTFHCGIWGGGPCHETDGLGASRAAGGEPYAAGFHTYSTVWDRSGPVEELRWYVDGQQYHSVRADQVPAQTWQRATGHGFFLLLNVAVGGGWPGPPTADTRPGVPMVVDRVSVTTRS